MCIVQLPMLILRGVWMYEAGAGRERKRAGVGENIPYEKKKMVKGPWNFWIR